VTSARPLTFQQALKKNLKRMLTFWAPLSVIFTGLGALLGFYTLSTYATAVGRPDLIAAALEAKSALVPWLATVIGMLAAYMLILLSTTVLFGLTVSMFNDAPPLQPKLTGVILVPALVGILGFLWLNFQEPLLSNCWKGIWALAWLLFALFWTLLMPSFRNAVCTCADNAGPGNSTSWPLRFWFMLMVTLLLASTVISAVFPTLLIIKAYIGKDTPEAVNRLMTISMFAACVALLPVIIFYVSKADLFNRIAFSVIATVGIGLIVIIMSPGSPAAIVYSAALVMKVRDPEPANFMLTKTYAKEDFDRTVWGSVEKRRGQPVVSAFPLFSFGDVLLLCPTSLITKQRQDWPQDSVYCVLTQSSNAIRVPKRATQAAAPAIKQIKKTPKSPAKCSLAGAPTGAQHDATATC